MDPLRGHPAVLTEPRIISTYLYYYGKVGVQNDPQMTPLTPQTNLNYFWGPIVPPRGGNPKFMILLLLPYMELLILVQE